MGSEVLKVKVKHNDPNYSKIFNFDLDFTADATSGRPVADVGVLQRASNGPDSYYYLCKIRRDEEPSGDGKDYDIVEISYNIADKDQKSSTKDYNLFGMMYNPDTGHCYLSDSALDSYIPLVDCMGVFKDMVEDTILSVYEDKGNSDELIEKTEELLREIKLDAPDIDKLFQKMKFITRTKESPSTNDYIEPEYGLNVYPIYKKALGGISSFDPFSEPTLLGSLIAYKKQKGFDQDSTDSTAQGTKEVLSDLLEDMKNNDAFIVDWLKDKFAPEVLKLCIAYLKFFSLLGNCDLPAGPIRTLVSKCASVSEALGDLSATEYLHKELLKNFYSIDLLKSKEDELDSLSTMEYLCANPFFNPELQEIWKTLTESFPSYIIDIGSPELSPEVETALKRANKLLKEKKPLVEVANITDFTSFPADAGLLGSSVIPEPSRDDYNYLITHLEQNKSALEVMQISSKALQKSVKNVVDSKVVTRIDFENLLKKIQENETIGPVITLLTKKVAEAIALIYQALNTKVFSK